METDQDELLPEGGGDDAGEGAPDVATDPVEEPGGSAEDPEAETPAGTEP